MLSGRTIGDAWSGSRPADGADPDLEAVLADAAHVALAEVGAPVSDVALSCLLGVVHRDRRWRLDVDRRGSSLGHERVAVEEVDGTVVALDRERSVERRGKTKGDLDRVGVHERREPTARVASVRGGQRAAKTVRKHDLHRRRH